ncbi:MAG: hypothetical protein P4N59_24675 [Negativicutes bacterium]|nr:hypothetical protein [Negativicutes bacterium]
MFNFKELFSGLDQKSLWLRWRWAVGLVLLLSALYWGGHWLGETFFAKPAGPVTGNSGDDKAANLPQVVYVQGQNTNTREIVYTPKEIDPTTGAKEKTDIQFDKRQGKIYVKVNGQDYEVPSDVKEDAKFENGKLVVTEQTELKLNITTPKPSTNIGLGWSLHGPAVQLNGPLYKNLGWWLYGDRKTFGGGIQVPIMK